MHPRPVPLLGGDVDTGHLMQGVRKLIGEKTISGVDQLQSGVGAIRHGDEVATGCLWQRLHQRNHQVLAQSRHLPVESVIVDLVEDIEGDMDRDTVGSRSRLELIGQRQADAVLGPRLWVVVGADRIGIVTDQEVLGEGQQIGLLPTGLLPPGVKVLAGHDIGRQPRVVEVDQRLVVDQDVSSPRPGLELGEALDQGSVVVEETVMRLPVTLHQCVANEQIARLFRIDAGIADLASDNQWDAIQGDLLQCDGRATLLLPVRLAVAVLDQMPGQPFDRRRVCACVDARPQTGGLDELGRHDPLRLLLEERRARRDSEARAPSADVFALLDVADANVREKSRKQRVVDRVVVGLG